MWVNREAYIELRANVKAQSQTIELLRQRVNELTEENAYLKGEKLGIPPVRVPRIEHVDPASTPSTSNITATPKVRGRVPADAPSIQDVMAGNLNFEDMGDEEARRQGVGHDETGAVVYN